MAKHEEFKLSSWSRVSTHTIRPMCPWRCLWQASLISLLAYKLSPEQPVSTIKGDISDGGRARRAS